MGELIPHSYLLLADLIQATRDELTVAGELPIMYKAEYEALVLDTIRNDASDIEDPDDVKEVTKFLHERGKSAEKGREKRRRRRQKQRGR